VGWFFTNSVGTSIPIYQGRGTWPVGRKRSNELLLNDMSGNVSEWVWDVTDDTFGRRFRGGSWSFPAESAELSRHGDGEGPDIQEDHRGFRVARNGPNGL
jgi:formylglycine-generating enzyme required for sulfatase activity